MRNVVARQHRSSTRPALWSLKPTCETNLKQRHTEVLCFGLICLLRLHDKFVLPPSYRNGLSVGDVKVSWYIHIPEFADVLTCEPRNRIRFGCGAMRWKLCARVKKRDPRGWDFKCAVAGLVHGVARRAVPCPSP